MMETKKMTKAQEIINTVDELARHYGKLIATRLLPWIPSVFVAWMIAVTVAGVIRQWGQESPAYTIGWEHLLMIPVLIIFPWVAGHMVGQIPMREDANADHNETTQDN